MPVILGAASSSGPQPLLQFQMLLTKGSNTLIVRPTSFQLHLRPLQPSSIRPIAPRRRRRQIASSVQKRAAAYLPHIGTASLDMSTAPFYPDAESGAGKAFSGASFEILASAADATLRNCAALLQQV